MLLPLRFGFVNPIQNSPLFLRKPHGLTPGIPSPSSRPAPLPRRGIPFVPGPSSAARGAKCPAGTQPSSLNTCTEPSRGARGTCASRVATWEKKGEGRRRGGGSGSEGKKAVDPRTRKRMDGGRRTRREEGKPCAPKGTMGTETRARPKPWSEKEREADPSVRAPRRRGCVRRMGVDRTERNATQWGRRHVEVGQERGREGRGNGRSGTPKGGSTTCRRRKVAACANVSDQPFATGAGGHEASLEHFRMYAQFSNKQQQQVRAAFPQIVRGISC